MALKGKVASLEEIPQGFEDHYVQQGDVWVLEVSDLPGADKLKEFRQRNIEQANRIKELEALASGVDLEEYQELKAKAQNERNKKLIDAGKIEEMFNERLAPMKADRERVEAELKATLAKREAKLEELLINNQIREVAAKSGVRATAIDDLILRGKQIFRVEGDNAVAKVGDEIQFGKSGEPLTMQEWVGGLVDKAPHLFEPSNGGGMSKTGGGAPRSGSVISRNDSSALFSNLEAVASGKVQVR